MASGAAKKKGREALPRGAASPLGLRRIGTAASAKVREPRIKDALALDFAALARKRKGR